MTARRGLLTAGLPALITLAVWVEMPSPVERVRFKPLRAGNGLFVTVEGVVSYEAGSAVMPCPSSFNGLADLIWFPPRLTARLPPFFRLSAAAALAAAALSSLAFALSRSACSALAISRGDGTVDRSFFVSVRREYGWMIGQVGVGTCFFLPAEEAVT